jgi:hypothetical protein
MGFELNAEEHPVKISAPQGEKWEKMTHFFRTPEESEILKYERMLPRTEFKRNKAVQTGSVMKAKSQLWGTLIVRVEGYDYNGKNIMDERSDWKKFIPIAHKVRAIDDFYEVDSGDEDDDAPLEDPSEVTSNDVTMGTDAQE